MENFQPKPLSRTNLTITNTNKSITENLSIVNGINITKGHNNILEQLNKSNLRASKITTFASFLKNTESKNKLKKIIEKKELLEREELIKKNKEKAKKEFNNILNILDKDDINFLYELIRRIFNKKYYTNSIFIFDKKKYIINIFEKSLLITNLNNKDYDTLLKISKAVYRVKLNQNLNDFNEESILIIKKILKKIIITDNNKINALGRLTSLGIPKASNNLEAFHNFNSIQYFIYKKENINDLDLNNSIKLLELSPLYYQNGLFYINPKLKELWKMQHESFNNYLKKNPDIRNLLPEKPVLNKLNTEQKNLLKDNIAKNNNLETIPLDEFIEKVDEINQTQFLRKIFENNIIEYKINHGNNKSFIKEENFDNFCKLFNNYIDTIAIFDNGKLLKEYTVPNNEIITNTKKKNSQSGGNEQLAAAFIEIFGKVAVELTARLGVTGGFIFLGGCFTMLACCIAAFYSLGNCYRSRGSYFRSIVLYIPCILWNTFAIGISGILTTLYMAIPIFLFTTPQGCFIYYSYGGHTQTNMFDPTLAFFNAEENKKKKEDKYRQI